MKASQCQPAATRKGALQGEVIVLLEDDELIRRATERLLRRFGAEVVAAASGGEALQALSARKLTPSWILADYWLGRQESGLGAATTIRNAAVAPVRGLIITGDLSREVADDIASAGFGLLRKPVNVDDFLDALVGTS
jgi:CheY-like chemotaxis protein